VFLTGLAFAITDGQAQIFRFLQAGPTPDAVGGWTASGPIVVFLAFFEKVYRYSSIVGLKVYPPGGFEWKSLTGLRSLRRREDSDS